MRHLTGALQYGLKVVEGQRAAALPERCALAGCFLCSCFRYRSVQQNHTTDHYARPPPC